jgi:hypothetical protein
MLNPPFKLMASLSTAGAAPEEATEAVPQMLSPPSCCDSHVCGDDPAAPSGRTRLSQLDMNFHCSVIGTCLTTAELRKLMARFVDVQEASDLDVHHEAVRHVAQSAFVAKALQKALDHRHAPAMQRFSRVQDAEILAQHWEEALRQGEIPGAYWAVLTHRRATAELRQKAFGDVHMLSHLVGAANRADIRRLVALEHDNAGLRERLDRHQGRTLALIEEKDRRIALLEQEAIEAAGAVAALSAAAAMNAVAHPQREEADAAAALIAMQTERRERAEQAAALSAAEATRLAEELEHLGLHALALNRELGAAELQLRELSEGVATPGSGLDRQLRGRRILYVGGRPSTAPAIRDLVARHGGELQRHGGGLEDRKGLLASAVGWAEVVVFPVDCIDHDSAGNLKRLCARQQVPYIPLRSAGVGCFAAAFGDLPDNEPARGSQRFDNPFCLRHG